MLGEKLDEHGATVWLVNTGWTGGPFGEGERMPIGATRALLHAALSGELDDGRLPNRRGVRVRGADAGAGRRRGAARSARRPGAIPAAYDVKARELAQMFQSNFEKFVPDAPPEVAAAGPRV